MHSSNEFSEKSIDQFAEEIVCEIPAYTLSPGKYIVDVSLGQRNAEQFQFAADILSFEIEFTGIMSDRTLPNQWRGVCGPGLLRWY